MQIMTITQLRDDVRNGGYFREKKAILNDVSDVSEAGWEVSQE